MDRRKFLATATKAAPLAAAATFMPWALGDELTSGARSVYKFPSEIVGLANFKNYLFVACRDGTIYHFVPPA